MWLVKTFTLIQYSYLEPRFCWLESEAGVIRQGMLSFRPLLPGGLEGLAFLGGKGGGFGGEELVTKRESKLLDVVTILPDPIATHPPLPLLLLQALLPSPLVIPLLGLPFSEKSTTLVPIPEELLDPTHWIAVVGNFITTVFSCWWVWRVCANCWWKSFLDRRGDVRGVVPGLRLPF